jgi:MFS family permease
VTAVGANPLRGRGPKERLVTPRFAIITASALGYFLGLGILLPTLPRYVENELGASTVEVGIVAGIFGVSAGLIRPWLGRLGDAYGRRVLLVVGAIISGTSIMLYPVWASIPFLVGLRVVSGIGEAGVFIGAAVSTQDLAPDDRRGEATSYFSLAVYLGIGAGPIIGEFLDRSGGFERVTTASSLLLFLSAVLGFAVPPNPQQARPAIRRKGFLHPAAVVPGALLTLSLVGFVGYTTFLSLYLDRLGGGPDTGNAGPVFLVYSAVVVVFRLAFASLPDRLGARRSGALAFIFIAAGLGIVAAWGTLTGIYVGTVVLALGVAFNYPALFLLVMARTEPSERGFAIASFGFFFDTASALGPPLLGLLIFTFGNERAAFAAGALTAAVGLYGLLRVTSGDTYRDAIA